MRKMKTFKVYLDDGKNVYKLYIPAFTRKDAEEYVAGNGDIVKIEDCTKEIPIELDTLAELVRGRYGEAESDIIIRCLREVLECVID